MRKKLWHTKREHKAYLNYLKKAYAGKPIRIHTKKLNITTTGFTEKGLVEYGKLRSKGIPKEKAVGMLIRQDKKPIFKIKL